MNFPSPAPSASSSVPDEADALDCGTDAASHDQLTVPDDLRDTAHWSDAGSGVPGQPSAAFATNLTRPAGDLMTTIGHIGRYALKSRIGEGGLGTVYAVHDPLLSRLIAIKTLSLNIPAAQRDEFNTLFLNEARAAAGLSHPHIVTVFDAGISDDNAYIAMELLSGLDLRQLRAEGWCPTATQAALIVRRVADALAYAHGKGVIHRDVKPANIFMVGRTQPRVLDFGIARMAHLHDTPGENEVAGGSPYYMAPEQVRRLSVDKRADVFSLGVVLYELLTDEKPFRGNTLDEIAQAVISHEPPMAHKVKAGVPVMLSEIASKAMEKDPEKRQRSARALARELKQWLDENGAPSDDLELSPRRSQSTQQPLSTWAWPGAAVLGAALVGAAAWWGLSSSSTPRLQTAAERLSEPAALAAPASAPIAAAALNATTQLAAPAPTGPTALAEISANDMVKSGPARIVGVGASNDASALTPDKATPDRATPDKGTPAPPQAKETQRDKRTRETKERAAKSSATAVATGAALPTGVLRMAISPWGQVEVNGKAVGTTPPLSELTLPQGKHQVTIRNDDFPPLSTTVTVTAGQAVSVKHRFGP